MTMYTLYGRKGPVCLSAGAAGYEMVRVEDLRGAARREDVRLAKARRRRGPVTQIRKGRFARPFSAVSWVTTLSNP
jgi:hypothetical protein